MTIFIKGLAFPIGEKNLNGWGIPESEVDNAINSLKASVLKICPGEAHACDFSEDPYARIGRIVDAWREPDGVHAKASITDSIAERKITEGSWDDRNWSTFANSLDPKLNDGWAQDFQARSMTLVKKPAWEKSTWTVAASDDNIVGLRTLSQFTLIASQSKEGENVGDKTPDEKLAELEKQLKEKDGKITELEGKAGKVGGLEKEIAGKASEIEELKGKAGKVEGLEKQIGELGASVKGLETQLAEKVTLIASMEKEAAVSIPIDEVMKKVAAAIEEHDVNQALLKETTEAREAFVQASAALGKEVRADQFTELTASDFKEMTEALNVKLAASSKPVYPADNGGSASKSQIFDPLTRTFTEA